MVRNYTRKTNRGELPKESFNSAISSVKEGQSIWKAANLHGINYRTLAHYLRKWEENGGALERVHLGYKKARLCLNEHMENDLAAYITKQHQFFMELPYTTCKY